MTQSSHFTKTTPRFPFADLCIPAGRSLFIHHSQTGGDGGGDHRCLKDTNYETILPLQKGTENEGNNYTQVPKLSSLADSEEGCENSESLCSKSSPQAKQ